jgi:hypothetical protein
MFYTILESMLKVQLPDRKDSSKMVDVYRYVIDENEEPTAVIFGKFSPWTGKKGHGRLLDAAKKKFKNVVIASPTRKQKDPKVDIFTDEQKEQIIEQDTGLPFYRLESSIPIRMFTALVEKGIKRPLLIVGPDRIDEFKKFFIEYNSTNKGIKDTQDPNFGKGEYYFIEDRGKTETSGTKVRKALLDNNKNEFIKLTGYGEEMWDTMRQMLKDNKVIKESLNFNHFYYLIEGGNVVVKGQSADKIPLDAISKKQYSELQQEIIGVLRGINKAFDAQNGKPLFPKFENNVKSGKLFSGSTRIFFEKSLDEFKRHKKSVGDIDIQYPNELMDKLQEFLASNEGKKFGKMIYLGSGGRSPTQENTIFTTKSFGDLFKNIQLDFEPTYWENDEPTEFSTFAHYSSWDDVRSKIKGVFSKYLMRAMVSAKESLGDVAIMTKTGKISTSEKYKDPSMRKFSVDKGMRVAFQPVLDNKGKIKKTEDGKPIYKELGTNKSVYERDLNDIFAFIFGQIPKGNEKEQLHSFVGSLKLMDKYLDKPLIKMIYSRFVDILWGKNGQEIEQGEWDEEGIQVEDFGVKKAAYDMFIKVFPEFKMNEKKLKEMVKPYYDALREKKG